MFAAGSCAKRALQALLDAGASLAARDKRGKGILDYAPEGSEVRTILQKRWVPANFCLSLSFPAWPVDSSGVVVGLLIEEKVNLSCYISCTWLRCLGKTF
jgi:hypothetical protein